MYAPSARGGHARYTWELLCALHRANDPNLQVELVTSRDIDARFRDGPYRVNAILSSLAQRSSFATPLHWIVSRLLHYPTRERAFCRWALSDGGIAAIHFQEFTPWLAARAFRRLRRAGIRLVFTVHNVRPHAYPRIVPRRVVDRWNRRAWMACDCLLVHTEHLREQLSKFLRGGHPPIYVAAHGVWTVKDRASTLPLSERLKWRRLLFFGQIRRNKGLHTLLDAMRYLPGFRLTIAGEASEPDYVEQEVRPRVAQLQRQGANVELVDRFVDEDEVEALFRSHSAVVLPYSAEFSAQSGVFFLALAYSVPVIASGSGGMGELLRHPVGVTFTPGEPEALAEAVKDLFSRASGRRLADAIDVARRSMSWDAPAASTITAYKAHI